MGKLHVIAGDLAHTTWHLTPGGMLEAEVVDGFRTVTHRVNVAAEIAALDRLDESAAKSFVGAAGWAVAGGALFGPAGALAGALLGGNSTRVAVGGTLADGRRFLATTDPDTLLALQAARLAPARPTPALAPTPRTRPARLAVIALALVAATVVAVVVAVLATTHR
jgi:hypothetical protein